MPDNIDFNPRSLYRIQGYTELPNETVTTSQSPSQETVDTLSSAETTTQPSYFEMVRQFQVKEATADKIQGDLEKDKQALDDFELLLNTLKAALAEQGKPITMNEIMNLNKLLYLMQQDFSTLDKEQIAFVQDERRKYNDQNIALMQDITTRLESTQLWSRFQAAASAVGLVASGVTIGGPLGIAVIAFAAGTALDTLLGDPVKSKIAWAIAGNDKQSYDSVMWKIQAGISAISFALTIGTYGFKAVQSAAAPGMNSFWDFANAVRNGGFFVDANGVQVAAFDSAQLSAIVEKSVKALSQTLSAITTGASTYHQTKLDSTKAQMTDVTNQIEYKEYEMRELTSSMARFISGSFDVVHDANEAINQESRAITYILTGQK